MKITSPQFENEAMIPEQFTCDGEEISPPLAFDDIPQNCRSFALIVDDPDAPNGTFTHWLLWNIPPDTVSIESNQVPAGAVSGINSVGKSGYTAPCPPSGVHHYNFRLFALNTMLALDPQSRVSDLVQEMEGHILDRAELVGLYGR